MNLKINLEDINLDNYSNIMAEINKFKKEAALKIKKLKSEENKKLLLRMKSEPIRGIDYCKIHHILRDDIQTIFADKINEMEFDSYGFYNNMSKNKSNSSSEFWFENDTFMLRPYSWDESDCTCGLDEEEAEKYVSENFRELGFHAIDCYNCGDRIVNFWYKPTNLKISWYKYPMRGALSNQEVTRTYIEAILEDCRNSMK